MTSGRIVGRGVVAALGLVLVVVGLTWLNLVGAAVMAQGGSCGSGGPYEIASPCPQGAWMAPAGIFLGLAGLALYALRRPPGSPQLLLWAWPALFGSLGVQFLRAAAAEPQAYGFWLCGVVFLAMAIGPLALVALDDRRALVTSLLGDGRAPGPDRPSATRTSATPAPGIEVTFVPPEEADDLAHQLERLASLHRSGDLSDAEYTDAKHQVLDRA